MTHSLQHSLFFKDLRCATYICKSTSINAKRPFVRILSRGPLFSILLVTYVTATTAYSANAFHPAGPHKILNISSFLGRLNIYRLYIYSLHWTSLDLRAAMVTLVMFCLFSVICDGPGYVPLKWKKGDKGRLLYLK